jgi:hypothetical protein
MASLSSEVTRRSVFVCKTVGNSAVENEYNGLVRNLSKTKIKKRLKKLLPKSGFTVMMVFNRVSLTIRLMVSAIVVFTALRWRATRLLLLITSHKVK